MKRQRCSEVVRCFSGSRVGGARGLLLALAWPALLAQAGVAQADVYMRQDGAGVTLTNVPESDGYAVMVVEPIDPPAREVAAKGDSRDSRDSTNAAAAVPAPGAAAGRAAAGMAGMAGVTRAVADARPGSGGGVAPFLGHLRAAASRHGVPEALLHAVIRVESNFNPRAVSPRGARGLMQLMPSTARWLGVNDAFDPAENIDAGARYLRHLLDQFDHNVHLAVAAYNAGPTAVRRSGGVPRFSETEHYVPRVLGHFEALGGRLPVRPASRWR